jgi:hypothetical protein
VAAKTESLVSLTWKPPRDNGYRVVAYELQAVKLPSAVLGADGKVWGEQALDVTSSMHEGSLAAQSASTLLGDGGEATSLYGYGWATGIHDLPLKAGAALRRANPLPEPRRKSTPRLPRLPSSASFTAPRMEDMAAFPWAGGSGVLKSTPKPAAAAQPLMAWKLALEPDKPPPTGGDKPQDTDAVAVAEGNVHVEALDWVTLADGVKEPAYLVTQVLPSSIYRFRVRAKNALGWGAWSQPTDLIMTKRKS